ncbi:DarT ssDNA thymidine ADP-ribosyltransferase family protein [Bradyrhizobium sp. IAR9]|uniref:DarT ssDNA thymidine ADP-ribosyltransferase family protein n=2 Tax=unclassified Bradyrhizobium TaxID=2631580 RepID=UPI0015CDF94B|nr:DarT ssDNA thymidine ADP-ribosyltransferase family protein [Bradyrhizobium sp. IAR9]
MRTEGIKCLTDPYRLQAQMSVPVCFVFRLSDVLCRADACFSSGNVQRSHDFRTGDAAFDQLDFDAIYHDSWTDSTNRAYIHDCRMAEVAVRNRLPLDGTLQGILFRTSWDMETFRYLLGEAGITCNYRMGVEQISSSLFMHEGLYLTDLTFSDDRLQMSFHFPLRHPAPENLYDVHAIQDCAAGRRLLNKQLKLDKPSFGITKYHPDGDAVWTIYLEKELAFRGRLQHARSQVFG